MQTTKRTNAIGLDIGQTSTKLLCLSRSGHKAVVKRAEIFRSREEGILGDDEQEQLEAISGWLKELKLQDQRVVLGLPQYMATTQLSDFAKGAKGAELEKMVGYETMQLAGISDDVFIHDYAVMPAGNGRENPVLIGIAREANVEDYVGRAAGVSIQIEDVAMAGLSLANAFFQLQPKAAKQPGVQLLLDIGTETTTMALVAQGQVVYIGSMMFGGTNMTQEIANQLKLAMDEAERRKVKGEVDWAELNLAAIGDMADGLGGLGDLGADDSQSEQASPISLTKETAEEPADGDDTPTLGLKLSLPGLGSSEDEATDDDSASPLKLSFSGAAEKGEAEDGAVPLKLSLSKEGEDSTDESEPSMEVPSLADDADTAESEPVPAPAPRMLSGLACFQTMLRELDNCLEHWRSSENDTLNTQKLAKIWISGGASQVELVANYLGVSQNCEVEVLGPQVEKKGAAMPEFTIAYGLALQGLGLAELPISLSPAALQWIHKKESRAIFLVLAFLLLLLASGVWLGFEYWSVTKNIEELTETTADLKKNVEKLTKLDGMKRDYSECLLQVLPVVSGVCRTQTLLTSLEQLQTAVHNPDLKECYNWCVYVSDSDSFREFNETKENKPVTAQQSMMPMMGRRRQQAQLLETTETVGDEMDQKWTATLEEENKRKQAMEVKPLEKIYVVGMIVSSHDNHNVIEREIMLSMGKGEAKDRFFSEVQVMNEEERKTCANRAVLEWEKCFENLATNEVFQRYKGGHKSFYLRLGLREPVIYPPAENPLGAPKKAKKK